MANVEHHAPRPVWQRILLGVLAGLFAVIAFVPAPGATADTPCAAGAQCSPALSEEVLAQLDADGAQYLPGQRWLDAFGVFHTRYDADAWNDLPRKSAAGATSIMFSFAQFLTGTRTNMLMWAMHSRSTFMESTDKIDEVWASVATAIWDSGIFLIAILAAVLTASWMWMWRNRMQSFRSVVKDVAVALSIFWMFAVLLAQAQSGGTISPGHLTERLVIGVDSLAAAPAAGLASSLDNQLADADDGAQNRMSCNTVISGMRDLFVAQSPPDAIEPTALLVDDRLTMGTLGKAWSLTQGGDTEFFNERSCLLLEWNARGANPTAIQRFFQRFDESWGVPKTGAFNMRSGQKQDVRFIAWMACTVNANGLPRMTTPWANLVNNGGGVSEKDRDSYDDPGDVKTNDYTNACDNFIYDHDDDGSDGGIFDFEEGEFPDRVDPNQIANAEGAQQVVDTVHSWQGYRQGNTLAGGIVAVVASLMILAITAFGALGCIFAGVFLIVVIPLGGPIVLAIAAFPGRSDMARKFGRRVVFAAAARALFVLQLSMLAALGGGILALFPIPGGTWGVLWHGLAWIAAGLMIHTATKKMGAPSTLSPSGAFAFAAGSVAGGAVMWNKTGSAPRRARGSFNQWRRNSYFKQQRKTSKANRKAGAGQGDPNDPGAPGARRPGRRTPPNQPNPKSGAAATGAAAAGAAAGAAAAAASTKPKPSLFGRPSRRAGQGTSGTSDPAAQTARQQERARRRSEREASRDPNSERSTRQQQRAEQVAQNRATRAEQRRNLGDAKWERRRARLETGIDGAAAKLRGEDTSEQAQQRRQRRAAATARVTAERRKAWATREQHGNQAIHHGLDEANRAIGGSVNSIKSGLDQNAGTGRRRQRWSKPGEQNAAPTAPPNPKPNTTDQPRSTDDGTRTQARRSPSPRSADTTPKPTRIRRRTASPDTPPSTPETLEPGTSKRSRRGNKPARADDIDMPPPPDPEAHPAGPRSTATRRGPRRTDSPRTRPPSRPPDQPNRTDPTGSES